MSMNEEMRSKRSCDRCQETAEDLHRGHVTRSE